jgi:hypothetical protein
MLSSLTSAGKFPSSSSNLFLKWQYNFETTSGSNTQNNATSAYDGQLINGASLDSTTGNFVKGSSALKLVAASSQSVSSQPLSPSIITGSPFRSGLKPLTRVLIAEFSISSRALDIMRSSF